MLSILYFERVEILLHYADINKHKKSLIKKLTVSYKKLYNLKKSDAVFINIVAIF